MEGQELTEGDKNFLKGLMYYYLSRNRSAEENFRRACTRRPDWGWPVFYVGRVWEDMLKPRKEWMKKYQEALTDSSVAPVVMDFIASKSSMHSLSSLAGEARKKISELPILPYLKDNLAFLRICEEIRNFPQKSPEETAEYWISIRERYPVFHLDHCSWMATHLTVHFNPDGYRDFIDMINPKGHEKRLLQLNLARRFLSEERISRAMEVIENMATIRLELEIKFYP